MRRLDGGLPEAGENLRRGTGKVSEPLIKLDVESTLASDKHAESVTISRANAKTAPTHKAKRTRVYSLSFPVCSV